MSVPLIQSGMSELLGAHQLSLSVAPGAEAGKNVNTAPS